MVCGFFWELYDLKNIGWFNFELPLLLILFLPGLMVVYMSATSMREGLVLALFIYGFMFLLRGEGFSVGKISVSYLMCVMVFIVFIMLHFAWVGAEIWLGVDYVRFVFSLLLLFCVLLLVPVFCNDLLAIGSARFFRVCRVIFWSMSVMGCVAGVAYLMGLNPYKKVVIFNEPSHFALLYLPFFLYVSCLSGSMMRFGIFLIALFIGLAIKNLTLLVGVLCLSVFIFGVRAYVFFAIIGGLAILLSPQVSEYNQYYMERMDFSGGSENFSVMVYVSGVERAYLSIIDSFGFGVGFQQLGIVGPQGEVMNKIINALGSTLNYNDGGFVGAKVVAEFGVFGVVLLVAYIFGFGSLFLRPDSRKPTGDLVFFFVCVYLAFFVEIFIRGAGYFTPSFFLFMVSVYVLFFLRDLKSNRSILS